MTYEEAHYYNIGHCIAVRYKAVYFEFIGTCVACPEQYDVYLEGRQVGYVRLRWASLSCVYPDVGGENIYNFSWYGDSSNDGYKGEFANDDERKYHLELIAKALYNRIFTAEHTAEG